MPIRVLHVVNSLGKGGLENGLVNLIDRMDPGRFEHVVCTIRGLGENLERLPRARIQVLSLARPGSQSRFQTPALVRTIRRFQPDIVHSRNWAAIEGVVAGRLARAHAVVHSEHGLEMRAAAKEPRRRVYFRRAAFELADRVLAVSHQLRDLHARRTGFPARKITVIHNGVDATQFFPDPDTRARMRQEMRIPESAFCIGCVANLLPVKDHATLLAAVDALPASCGDWRLLIVGDGPEGPKLKTFVEAHPRWKDKVLFLGTSGRVRELLTTMDVFVLASVAEGICNALLEAMATGVPVIASAVGGNPEVVVGGESGLLFPAGVVRALTTHLSQLAAEPALRAALGRRARERVRSEFSVQSMVHAYEQLYLSLGRAAGAPALSVG
jgi:sugar transferase (PEP-CTERM/EpsH1 system associated)